MALELLQGARRPAAARIGRRRGAKRTWRRVDLRNYRSIESVSVELAPFSALVGPNGSGKSNFADALVFARDVATDAASAVERRGGADPRRHAEGRPGSFGDLGRAIRSLPLARIRPAPAVTDIGPLASAQRDLVRQGLFSVAELMRSEPLRIEGETPAVAEP